MKIKKTTSLAVTGALLASGLGATLFAQAQHNDQTHQAGAAAPPKMGMMGEGMAAHHDKMMAEMKAADTKLDALVAKMNAAKGNAKVEAMAAVINELAAQRKAMRAQMQTMHDKMMGGGMMGGSGMTGDQNAKKDKNMKHQIPGSISAEHEELHRELEKAIESGGKTGEAAKIVAERLHSHFEKEEQYALPQLGLLSQLAQGKASEEMRDAIALADKLKADLPQMLEEHKAIVVALDNLSKAAKGENKIGAVEFAENLKMHARMEEEVMYPAAILVGEYLKLRLKN